MDPPLHSAVKSNVSWVDINRWKPSKAPKGANISRQGFGLRILWCARYFVHWLPWERKNHQYRILYCIIGAFEGSKKRLQMKKKNVLSPRQCILSQVHRNDGKTTWILLRIAFAPILFSRSGPPATTGCFKTSKECSWQRDLVPMKWYRKLRRILRPKTNCSTKKGIELLEKRWKETMLMNKVEFCLKVVLLVRPGTYRVMYDNFICYVKINVIIFCSPTLGPR